MSSVKLAAALPFAIAVVFYLLSPLLTAKVKTVLEGQVVRDASLYGQTAGTAVPPQLRPEMIKDYVEYVADAVQIIPATMLPVVGAIFTISSKLAVNLGLIILVSAVVLAITMDAIVLSRAAADYVSRKWHGYSPINLVGIIVNLLGLSLVLALA